MKHLAYFLLTFVVYTSSCSTLCVDCEEETIYYFENRIENLSGQPLLVIELDQAPDGRILRSDTFLIENGSITATCTYSAEQYVYHTCASEIQLLFSNNKGYRCVKAPRSPMNVSELCLLDNRDPFSSPFQESDSSQGSLITITEADYDNAFDL